MSRLPRPLPAPERLRTLRPDGAHLLRFLSPRSVAVVGASERRHMSNVALGHLVDADVELHLVHPTATQAYGQPALPSLAAIGRPVDAVLALVAARWPWTSWPRPAGSDAEAWLSSPACSPRPAPTGWPCRTASGPPDRSRHRGARSNCTGFANVSRGVALFTGTPVPLEAGGLSIVSQSGYLTRAALVAARKRNLGARLAISCGNEAVTGLAGLINHLATTLRPTSSASCSRRCGMLPLLRCGRPSAGAGKPVIAVKLRISDRGLDIVRSHTGALATESWVYEVGLRQKGVVLAEDLDDLLDRSQFLLQVPTAGDRFAHDLPGVEESDDNQDSASQAGIALARPTIPITLGAPYRRRPLRSARRVPMAGRRAPHAAGRREGRCRCRSPTRTATAARSSALRLTASARLAPMATSAASYSDRNLRARIRPP